MLLETQARLERHFDALSRERLPHRFPVYAIEHGLDVFEPGAGGEHKRARGFVPTLTHSFHWLADARMRSVIGQHLVEERARVREHVAAEGGEDDDAPLTKP